MQAEDRGEEIEKIPDLDVAQWCFLIEQNRCETNDKKELQQKIIDAVLENKMSFFYKECLQPLGVPLDENVLEDLESQNKATLVELDAAIKDAEENLGETEVRDAYYKKAVHLCRIGDKENAISALKATYEKTVGVGRKMDLVFFLIRIGLFYADYQMVNTNLSKIKYLMEQGGDWDRKNRLKAYEGLYCLAVRDFKKAADSFLDATSTFTSYELMSYEKLTFYAVVSAMLALDRNSLREKVLKGAEVQEQLHAQKDLKAFVASFYDCNYAEFFAGLALIEPLLKSDRFLSPHYVYYTRAMRTKAYKQLISSYSSLTLQYMADSFGVTVGFIDKELHQLIALGELSCKIEGVRGLIETSQVDAKAHQYQAVIRQGDILLNRIQKLGHVITA